MNLKKLAFRSARDIGLFLKGARSDARLEKLRQDPLTSATAFDHLYATAPENDPWASAVPKYQYQRRKYDALISLLPERSYREAADLGCGLGLFTERLAPLVERVVGIDISSVAISLATARAHRFGNVQFRQGDITALDADLNGRFDLVVVADAIYYLPPPIQDATLKQIAVRISDLLTPEGVLLLVNHYFGIPNSQTHLTHRIHRAFQWTPTLTLMAEHRRAFYLATLLCRDDKPI